MASSVRGMNFMKILGNRVYNVNARFSVEATGLCLILHERITRGNHIKICKYTEHAEHI